MIDASGVRRSWVTDEKSAARSRFVSASIRASSASDPSRMPSIARAICEASVWITPRSSEVIVGWLPSTTTRILTELAILHRHRDHVLVAIRHLAVEALRDDRAVGELADDLASGEVEELEDRPGEAPEHVFRRHAGAEARAQVMEQPGFALAPLRSRPLLERTREHRADGRRDGEEHREGHEVRRPLDRERVERRREEEVQCEEGGHRGDQSPARALRPRRRSRPRGRSTGRPSWWGSRSAGAPRG